MQYYFNFTQQEIQVIQMGLGELPLKIGINLLGKLQEEIAKQNKREEMMGDRSYDTSDALDPDMATALGL